MAQPVVYLTTSYLDALSIRACQIRNQERFGPAQVLGVTGDYELLIDPYVKETPFGNVAFMVYQDIPAHHLQTVYA